MRPELSVVVPAYNEAATIEATLGVLRDVLASVGHSYEIIVGNDGSTDGTASLVDGLGHECVRVISRPHAGKGGILSACFAETRGRLVGFIDADLEIRPEHIPHMIELLEGGADAVVASKTINPEIARRRPPLRRLATATYNAMIRGLFGTRLQDHQAGLKFFTGEALESALPVGAAGWTWDTEVLVKLARLNASIVEVPIEPQPVRRPSKIGFFASSTSMLLAVLGLYWQFRRSPGASRPRTLPAPR